MIDVVAIRCLLLKKFLILLLSSPSHPLPFLQLFYRSVLVTFFGPPGLDQKKMCSLFLVILLKSFHIYQSCNCDSHVIFLTPKLPLENILLLLLFLIFSFQENIYHIIGQLLVDIWRALNFNQHIHQEERFCAW